MNVLLVEANAAALEAVQSGLNAIRAIQVVKVARTQHQACQWLAANPDGWDLALVDLFLDEGSGFHVLRCCHKLKPHQRAVVLSNYSKEPVRQYARLAGADAFFDQAFERAALLAYCTALCRTVPRPPGQH